MSGTSERPQKHFQSALGDDLCPFCGDSSSKGAVSWWLRATPDPLLIDCPEVNSSNIAILKKLAINTKPRILLTSREGHGRLTKLQSALGWPVLIQEQEAYLLPGVSNLETFSNEYITSSGIRLLWTPGPTPGSCVVHAQDPWNVLFCGRLLMPVEVDRLSPLQKKTTFHWRRQRESLKKLRNWIPSDRLPLLALGSGLGAVTARQLFKWESWKEPYFG